MNYVIVIDDGGELKTITALELEARLKAEAFPDFADKLEAVFNLILDDRAVAAGEYDPADNDTPIEVR